VGGGVARRRECRSEAQRSGAKLWLINLISRDGILDGRRGVMRFALGLFCSNHKYKQALGPLHYHIACTRWQDLQPVPARTNGGAYVALLMLWISHGYWRWLHGESVKASTVHGRFISLLRATSSALPPSLLCRLCSPSSPFGIPLFFLLRHSAPLPGNAPLLLFSRVTETRPSASSRCPVPSRFPARLCLSNPLCITPITPTA
jgi:hypothetical protein